MLTEFVWNGTAFVCQTELFENKLFWYLIVCKQKTILTLNWIVWNRTVYLYKNGFSIKKPTKADMP